MDVGRPKHSEWGKLGFKAKLIINASGKKVNLAYCLQCEKCITNTAAARLRSHRNVCKLAIDKLKDEQKNPKCDENLLKVKDVTTDDNYDGYNNEVEKRESTKRKASTSLNSYVNNSITNEENTIDDDDVSVVTVTQKHNIEKNEFKSLYKKDKEVSNFLDKINNAECAKIDEALVELLIMFDIDFENVNSSYFKNFIRLLRPAYNSRLPKIEELSTEILSRVYTKHIDKNKFRSNGTLLINYQETLISLTINESGKYMFVKKQEIPNEDNQLFIENSILIVKNKYDSDIHAIISDVNLPISIIGNQNYYFITCISVKLRSLVKSIVDYEILNQINLLLDQFSIPALKEQLCNDSRVTITKIDVDDFESYYDGFFLCFKNLNIMRKILGDNMYIFNKSVVQLLFNDSDFENKLNEIIPILKFVQDVNNKRRLKYLLADKIEDWNRLLLETTIIESHKHVIIRLIDTIFDPISLAANYFNPRYRGRCFKNNEQFSNRLLQFLIERLDEQAMGSYFEYQEESDTFKILFDKNYETPEIFWRVAAQKHKSLSNFALKILKIPAFTTNQNVTALKRSFSSIEEQNKITELYLSMKINEQ